MGQSEAHAKTVFFPDQPVHNDGRVTLPADRCRHYGIEKDDRVDLQIETEGGQVFPAPDRKVLSSFRVTIPSHQRDKYGIKDGEDEVDVYVRVEVE